MPRCRFAVLALTACGVGLNLACADTAVFVELCWTPSMLEQAEARVHRMGQKASHVSIYFLTAGEGSDSPDSAMFGALVNKSRAAARVVDGGAPINDLGSIGMQSPPSRRAEESAQPKHEEKKVEVVERETKVLEGVPTTGVGAARKRREREHGAAAGGASSTVAEEVIELSDSDEEPAPKMSTTPVKQSRYFSGTASSASSSVGGGGAPGGASGASKDEAIELSDDDQ